jgi:hypothetical protein
MHIAQPFGLITLLAVPAIVLLHWYRPRRPVRRVAGAFLWATPTAAARQNGRPQSWLHAGAFGLDVTVAVLLTTIAVDVQFGGAAPSGDPAVRIEAVFQTLLCVAAAGLLAWSWRHREPTGRNTKSEQP